MGMFNNCFRIPWNLKYSMIGLDQVWGKMTHIRKCEEIILRPEIWWNDAIYHDGSLFEMATLSQCSQFLISRVLSFSECFVSIYDMVIWLILVKCIVWTTRNEWYNQNNYTQQQQQKPCACCVVLHGFITILSWTNADGRVSANITCFTFCWIYAICLRVLTEPSRSQLSLVYPRCWQGWKMYSLVMLRFTSADFSRKLPIDVSRITHCERLFASNMMIHIIGYVCVLTISG